MERHFASSADLRAYVKKTCGRKVLLAFSRGKDAIAAWLALRHDGFEVVPYHLDLIPGLQFVDESIRYFEDFFETKIHRFVHPSFWRWLDALVFQPPERCAIIERVGVPSYDYPDVVDKVRELAKLPKGLVATGVRSADSPIRRMSILKHGALNPKEGKFAAVFDWRVDDLRAALSRFKVELPIDYKLWGRSFDGIDFRFLEPLRRELPRDYARLLEWFPLADLEFFRRGQVDPGPVHAQRGPVARGHEEPDAKPARRARGKRKGRRTRRGKADPQ